MNKLTLSNSDLLDAVGLGLWKIEPAAVASVVADAIQLGYRHFDSASDYGNEEQVGVGLQRAISAGVCRREDLWITSKLWNTYHRPEHVRTALERTLRDLQLDYLDLYLIHFPIALEFVPFEQRYPAGWIFDPDAAAPAMHPVSVPLAETWRAMEAVKQAGLVRNIGVCNFGVSLLRDLLCYAETAPAMLQVELHPYLTQEKLLRFCREQGIAVTGFSPLGAGSYLSLGMAEQHESVLDEPTVQAIASAHGRTAAQIVLRWGVQRGTSVVPKSMRRERLAENLAIFDFKLSAADMNSISSLNRNRRFNDPGVFCEAAFNTFFPIYE